MVISCQSTSQQLMPFAMCLAAYSQCHARLARDLMQLPTLQCQFCSSVEAAPSFGYGIV